MSSYTSISVDKLSRLIGTANTPALIDVRTDEDFAVDPRILPGALRRTHETVAEWANRSNPDPRSSSAARVSS
jgi:rhodanese-related sulfurtransferase